MRRDAIDTLGHDLDGLFSMLHGQEREKSQVPSDAYAITDVRVDTPRPIWLYLFFRNVGRPMRGNFWPSVDVGVGCSTKG